MLLPVLALLTGFGEGVTHWSFYTLWDGGTNPRVAVAFVQMVPLLYLAAVVGAFSAQLGLLLVAGFALGDWFLADPAFQYPNLSRLGHFLQIGLPQLISYGLLFLLAVQPTLAAWLLAGSLRRPARPSGRARFWFVAVLAMLLQGLIVYAWTFSAPMVVRSIWMWAWHNEWPPLTIPYFTGVLDPGLPAAAAIAALARAVLTWWARGREAVRHNARKLAAALTEADRRPAFTRRLPSWAGALLSALVVTLLLGGFIATLWLGISMFGVIAAILVGRAVVLPGVPGWGMWAALAGKAPLLVRWLIVVGAGCLAAWLVYLTSGAAVQANQAAGAFGPELTSVVLGLVVATLLLPGGGNVPGRPVHVQFGTGAARAAAVVVLLVGLAWARPALAVCADSFCCFVSNNQAILAVAALQLLLTLPLLPEELALAGIVDLAEIVGAQVEGVGLREAERKLAEMASHMAQSGESPPNLAPPGVNRDEALDQVKEDKNIPLDEVPDVEANTNDDNSNRPGSEILVYINRDGEIVTIRHDYDGHDYVDDPTQNRGPHFNIDQPDGRSDHYDYTGGNQPFGPLRRRSK